MKLAELIAGLDVKLITPGAGAVRVCDLTEDSRTVLPGSLFVARAGLKADGRKYITDAVHAGAVAVLVEGDPASGPAAESLGDLNGAAVVVAKDVAGVSGLVAERFYGRPATKLKVVAVTGTNGKTTTAFLVWQLLNAADLRCGLVGTVLIDDGREVAAATMTTPPAIEMSRTLGEMVEAGCKAVALEASSHSLHQKRLDALAFDVGVFTNLTGDHLDYHKTMEAYADAKARLFEMLPEGAMAVVNADDAARGRMLRDCRARVLATGRATGRSTGGKAAAGVPEGSAVVETVGASMEGMDLRLAGPWGEIEARVPLIGGYNAMNVLQAVACCHDLGMETGLLRELLPKVTAPPGRLERVSVPGGRGGPNVFVDYAHTDDALRNVLTAVRAGMRGGDLIGGRGAGGDSTGGGGGKLWVVFGCGGDKDKTKRPRMGAAAAELADRVVVTSDNPRSENPKAIVDQVLAGIAPARRGHVEVQVEREPAIFHAIQKAEAGDVIVIAGKGHETEQIKSDGAGGLVSLHFDDREVARKAMEARLAPVADEGLANRGDPATMGRGASEQEAGKAGEHKAHQAGGAG